MGWVDPATAETQTTEPTLEGDTGLVEDSGVRGEGEVEVVDTRTEGINGVMMTLIRI